MGWVTINPTDCIHFGNLISKTKTFFVHFINIYEYISASQVSQVSAITLEDLNIFFIKRFLFLFSQRTENYSSIIFSTNCYASNSLKLKFTLQHFSNLLSFHFGKLFFMPKNNKYTIFNFFFNRYTRILKPNFLLSSISKITFLSNNTAFYFIFGYTTDNCHFEVVLKLLNGLILKRRYSLNIIFLNNLQNIPNINSFPRSSILNFLHNNLRITCSYWHRYDLFIHFCCKMRWHSLLTVHFIYLFFSDDLHVTVAIVLLFISSTQFYSYMNGKILIPTLVISNNVLVQLGIESDIIQDANKHRSIALLALAKSSEPNLVILGVGVTYYFKLCISNKTTNYLAYIATHLIALRKFKLFFQRSNKLINYVYCSWCLKILYLFTCFFTWPKRGNIDGKLNCLRNSFLETSQFKSKIFINLLSKLQKNCGAVTASIFICFHERNITLIVVPKTYNRPYGAMPNYWIESKVASLHYSINLEFNIHFHQWARKHTTRPILVVNRGLHVEIYAGDHFHKPFKQRVTCYIQLTVRPCKKVINGEKLLAFSHVKILVGFRVYMSYQYHLIQLSLLYIFKNAISSNQLIKYDSKPFSKTKKTCKTNIISYFNSEKKLITTQAEWQYVLVLDEIPQPLIKSVIYLMHDRSLEKEAQALYQINHGHNVFIFSSCCRIIIFEIFTLCFLYKDLDTIIAVVFLAMVACNLSVEQKLEDYFWLLNKSIICMNGGVGDTEVITEP